MEISGLQTSRHRAFNVFAEPRFHRGNAPQNFRFLRAENHSRQFAFGKHTLDRRVRYRLQRRGLRLFKAGLQNGSRQREQKHRLRNSRRVHGQLLHDDGKRIRGYENLRRQNTFQTV